MSDIFKNSLTFRLFKKRPSFFEGASSLLDLGANVQRYNLSSTDDEADYEALKSDWQAVGDDLRSSIKTYEQSLAKSA
ncbi:MAG: hypothetical protein KGJ35_01770 [Patescibacteria group bacterium]|nr:hypothetical protein [Patescibacteria group bacterium]